MALRRPTFRNMATLVRRALPEETGELLRLALLRWRRAPIYIGDHTLLARTRYGDWLYLDSRDSSLTPTLAMTGTWEPWIADVFRGACRPGMSVVDIGCNCGFYAVLAARCVGARGRVVAIDANPRMVELTRRSVNANFQMNITRVVHGAVVDVEGDVEIGIPDDLMGSGSMTIRAGEHPQSVTTIRCPGRPLDAWIGADRRIDVLKVDTEGAEPLILRGAEALLRENRDIKVLIEFAPPMIRHFEPPLEMLRRIRALGFSVYEIAVNGRPERASDDALLQREVTELYLTRE